MNKIMKELGYTDSWIHLGIIDLDTIESQYNEFLSSDSFSEHYRVDRLNKYLDQKISFTDKELELLLEIFEDDKDLESTLYLNLLSNQELNKKQFEFVAKSFMDLGKWAIDKLSLIRLERSLLANKLSKKDLIEIIDKQNAKEHHLILNCSNLEEDVLIYIAENSKFSKVVNKALNRAKKVK